MASPTRAVAPAVEARTRRRGGGIEAAWVACATLLPGIGALVAGLRTTDLAYHLRVGEEILRTGSIPSVDTYTFTVLGAPWIDQQWGAQVVFALVHRAGGWEAMTVARAVLTIATFGFVYLACRARGARPRTAALLSLAGFIVSMIALPMRPQLIALPALAAAMWLLASRARRPRRLVAVPLLALVLANVHGSFVLVPALAAFAAIDDVRAKRAGAGRTVAAAAASLLLTLVNPFGVGAWTYAYDLATNDVIRTSITEWQPLDVSGYPGILVFVSLAALVALLAIRPRRVDLESLLGLGLLAFMTFSAQRSIALWGVLVPAVAAGILAGSAGADRAGGPDEPVRVRSARGPALVLLGALVALLVALLPWWRSDRPASLLDDVPFRVTEQVRARLPAGTNLLVHQPWGSWFLWATPEIPLFLDSRIEIVPKDVWRGYDAVAFAGAGWREALERWDVQAIVAEKASWTLIPRLRQDAGWRVAYEDDEAILFVRS